MRNVDHLPDTEKRHFIRCACGEWIDCRNLEEVFAHEHAYNLPAAEYTHCIKVGEPVAYTKTNKEIDLN